VSRAAVVPPRWTMSDRVLPGSRVSSGESKLRFSTPAMSNLLGVKGNEPTPHLTRVRRDRYARVALSSATHNAIIVIPMTCAVRRRSRKSTNAATAANAANCDARTALTATLCRAPTE